MGRYHSDNTTPAPNLDRDEWGGGGIAVSQTPIGHFCPLMKIAIEREDIAVFGCLDFCQAGSVSALFRTPLWPTLPPQTEVGAYAFRLRWRNL